MEKAKKFPLLSDAAGETLSMAPIINSASLGAVQVGDRDLLVEMTGTDMPSLLLATMIVACDFFDRKVFAQKFAHRRNRSLRPFLKIKGRYEVFAEAGVIRMLYKA